MYVICKDDSNCAYLTIGKKYLIIEILKDVKKISVKNDNGDIFAYQEWHFSVIILNNIKII